MFIYLIVRWPAETINTIPILLLDLPIPPVLVPCAWQGLSPVGSILTSADNYRPPDEPLPSALSASSRLLSPNPILILSSGTPGSRPKSFKNPVPIQNMQHVSGLGTHIKSVSPRLGPRPDVLYGSVPLVLGLSLTVTMIDLTSPATTRSLAVPREARVTLEPRY
jgi:hypothetical protein